MYTAVLLAAISTTPTQPGFQGHHGFYGWPQIQHGSARIQGGKVTVKVLETKLVQETKTVIEKVRTEDGKEIEVPRAVIVTRSVPLMMDQIHAAAEIEILDSTGKPVEPEAASARLEKSARVLLVFPGQPLDPAYLSLLKKETLILVLPRPVLKLPPVSPQKTTAANGDRVRAADMLTAFITTQAKENVELPMGPPPGAGRATIDAKGQLSIEETTTHGGERTGYYEEEHEGVLRKVPFTLRNTSVMKNVRSVDARLVAAHDVNGNPIDAGILLSILSRPTNVLISSDGKQVDPYYLQVFDDRAVVVLLPTPNLPQPPMPAPAPIIGSPKKIKNEP